MELLLMQSGISKLVLGVCPKHYGISNLLKLVSDKWPLKGYGTELIKEILNKVN